MRLKPAIFSAIVALSSTFLLAATASAQSVQLMIDFGTKQDGVGECVGKGLCESSDQQNAPGINVLFQTSADQNTLILSFSLNDLKNSQPEQVAYFTSGSYVFSSSYSLSDPMFSGLNLPQNAMITPNSNSTVVINGDAVTDYITLSYDN